MARYIKLDYEEALSAKKELLSSELHSLVIAKKIKEYKFLRAKEFTLKKKFRTEIISLKNKTNLFISTLPKDENKSHKPKKVIKEKKVEKGLQNELEEIKRKLERLSN